MKNNDYGKIVVNARYANSASPAFDVKIAVLRDGETLDSFNSENGRGALGGLPEGEYDLNVSAYGFFDKTIYGIKAYERKTTLVNVELFPLYITQKENIYEN